MSDTETERTRGGTAAMARDLSSEIAKNFLMGIPAVRRWRLKRPRTATSTEDVREYLQTYAFSGLGHLDKYASGVQGKSVCEIGAGDFLTSGLAMLAAGAAFYGVIDRFAGDYYGAEARSWYAKIEKEWPSFFPGREWPSYLSAEGFPENATDRLELNGDPIETAVMGREFDIVCSFQVGEHVSNIDRFAEVHNRLLKPDGIGLHRIDFAPHHVWSLYRDPGTFLRFPEGLWNMTGSNRGVPNRRRHHEFLAAFDRAGLDVEVLSLARFSDGEVDLSKLHRRFRNMPKESVLVESAIYRLKKRR